MVLWTQLRSSIIEKDLEKFEFLLNDQIEEIKQIKPRNLNEILLDCLKIYQDPLKPNGCDFIEHFMYKLSITNCHFVCWDDSCKSIVQLYLDTKHNFSPYSICFLLRCYDLELIKNVFDLDLINPSLMGECENWHLMFVASYQERFFTHCFDTIFEGFLARFILICKLRCSLKHKRSFLTWFAGSLHLYTDEYFLQNEESRFKFVLVKLFECLILNGLLSNNEFKNLLNMLMKRNEEMLLTLNSKSITGAFNSSSNNNQQMVTEEMLKEDSMKTSNNNNNNKLNYFPNLDSLFPLSLKNTCRLVIKRSMTKFTRSQIDTLPLPSNLKKFIFFEFECESVYKSFYLMKKN